MRRNDPSSNEIVFVEIDRVIAQTELAILVENEDGEEVWIPQSRIHADSEVWKKGDSGKLAIPRWLAEAKGLSEL